MKTLTLTIAAALFLSGTALAANDSKKQMGQTGSMSGSASELIPKDEKSFAEVLHHANQSEIKLGQLAQQKGQSQSVKDLGQMMVTDHQKLDQDLMAMAKSKGWKLTEEPKASNDTQKALMSASKANEAKLKALSGPAFDSSYAAIMVDDHDLDITKVGLASQQFQGSDFGQKLQQVLPTLQMHRQHAYQTLGQVKAEGAMGVGGAGSSSGMGSSPGSSGSMGSTGSQTQKR